MRKGSTRPRLRPDRSSTRRVRSSVRKYIYDPVHGSISLTGPILELVGHPFLQRLWGIRQTGLAHLVFPGASHTRLEHSLGVLWVVRAMASGLGLEPAESLPLEVAGLLHDLGHTPFSHTLEPVLEEATGETHEGVTARLIVGDVPSSFAPVGRGVPGYDPPSIPVVLERHGLSAKEIAKLLRNLPRERSNFRSEMLHGSIDADRLDYLQRDAHYTGVAHGVIDANRLLETVRRDRGHLVFAEKARPAVEGFLVARSLMYSTVYYNKTVRVAEVMLQSALERLPSFPHVEDLLALTDADLLAALEREGGRPCEIARRLKVRQLYKRAATLDWAEAGAHASLWERLAGDPELRRSAEDRLGEMLEAPPGTVLLDLALSHRGAHWPGKRPATWDPLWIWQEGGIVDLLRDEAVWPSMLGRPITPWAVAIYAPAPLQSTVARRARRLFAALG